MKATFERFIGNLLGLVFVVSVGLLGLAAAGFLLAFGLSVADHVTGDTAVYPFQVPAIRWWLLGAAVGAAVLAVAIYSLASEDGETYYCPNCNCPDCQRERDERQQDELLAAAAVGGMVGGSIGRAS